MLKIVLCLLLFAAPALAKIPQSHLQAIQAIGLPLYVLPDNAQPTYSSAYVNPSRPSYSVDYLLFEESGTTIRVRCSRAPMKGLRSAGRALESRQVAAGVFGKTTVTRHTELCRTDWLLVPGGALVVESDTMPLDRFVQILEQFRRLPQVAPGNPYQAALTATGLANVRLGNFPSFSEEFDLHGSREWHGLVKTYLVDNGGTFRLSLSRGGIGDVNFGLQPSSTASVVVAGLGKIRVAETLKAGRRVCWFNWIKVGKGYLYAESEDISRARFQELVKQLRVISR